MIGLVRAAHPLLKWSKAHPLVLAAGVLPLITVFVLLVRAPVFPVRTLYGSFFVVLFVPIASIAAAAAGGGMRAAFAVSGVVLVLTMAQALLPVRQANLVLAWWDVALDRPEVRASHRLALGPECF